MPALIDLIEGTLLLCSKVGSDLGLGNATYRILPCLITRRFPSRFYPIPHMDKKFLNVNIIYFENVDKPEGGGRTMWIRLFC